MLIQGSEIHRTKDKLGPIIVLEEGGRRFLAFDEKQKQSCVSVNQPWELAYEYTQAMALALAMTPKVERCFIGGLGGGSLAHFLLKFFPGCEITALEYRAAVVKVAREFFFLPDTPKLDVRVEDLKDYLSGKDKTRFDVMWLDLYTADGMHEQQKNLKLYKRSFKRLSGDGVMVVNLASQDPKNCKIVVQELEGISGQGCYTLKLGGGNFMAFAFKGEKLPLNQKVLNERVEALSKLSSHSFGKIAERLA